MARKYAILAMLAGLCLSGCKSSPNEIATGAPIETPIKITACQLMTDPAAYNHKLVEVSGHVSVGFEEFSIYPDDGCAAKDSPWLELGGSVEAGVTYCCGDHSRNVPLEVEGIVTPLVDDWRTRRFVKAAQTGSAAGPTTLVGRFFSGNKLVQPWGTFWVGYGHMGCCSLLVIQQVLD